MTNFEEYKDESIVKTVDVDTFRRDFTDIPFVISDFSEKFESVCFWAEYYHGNRCRKSYRITVKDTTEKIMALVNVLSFDEFKEKVKSVHVFNFKSVFPNRL